MGSGLGWPECVCNVGCQECGLHPGRVLTKEQSIAFRKKWDAEVDRASERASRGD
jgi:hypothetical protein